MDKMVYTIKEPETGIKFDNTKPELEILLEFSNQLIEVGKLAELGAKKYSKENWKHVLHGEERYTSAMLRHLLAEKDEAYDPETMMLHATAVAWNALARLHFIMEKNSKEEKTSNGA